MEDQEFDRHYTDESIAERRSMSVSLRNLIDIMYENEQLTFSNHELVELFT